MKLNLSNPKHRIAFISFTLILSAMVFTIIGYLGTKSIYEAKLELIPSPTPSVSPSPTPSVSITSSAVSSEIEKLKEEKNELQSELDNTNKTINQKMPEKA